MAETTTPTFDDGEAYERFMGRWSGAVGTAFLDWLEPPQQARWLDVGCGTGIVTQLVAETRAPAALNRGRSVAGADRSRPPSADRPARRFPRRRRAAIAVRRCRVRRGDVGAGHQLHPGSRPRRG